VPSKYIRSKVAFCFFALAAFWSQPSHAASIRIISAPEGAIPAGGFETKGIRRIKYDSDGRPMKDYKPPNLWISLSGHLERGDAARLDRVIARAKSPEPDGRVRILPDSNGGDYAEAMKIADATQRTMVVGPGGTCHAACTIVFMSGRQIDGDGYFPPDRYAHVGANINFYAPEFDFPENATPAQLSAAYNRAIELSRDLLRKRRLWWISNDFFLAPVNRQHDWKNVAKTSSITLIGAGN